MFYFLGTEFPTHQGRVQMPKPEHLIGQSNFYDRNDDELLVNSMTLELDLTTARWEIRGANAPEGAELIIENPVVIRALHTVIAIMRRQARRYAKVQPEWKHRTTDLEEVCPECGGRQLKEDPATGEEWACPVCNV